MFNVSNYEVLDHQTHSKGIWTVHICKINNDYEYALSSDTGLYFSKLYIDNDKVHYEEL